MANPIEAKIKSPDFFREHSNQGGNLTREQVTTTTIAAMAIVIAVAAATWFAGTVNPGIALSAALIGSIGLLVTALISVLSNRLQPTSVGVMVLFAVLEGLLAGGFTFSGATFISGKPAGEIIGQALMATVAVVFAATWLYRSGKFVPSARLRNAVRSAGWGFVILYAVNLLVTLIAGKNFLFSSGPLPIIIGLVAVIVATLSIIDTLATSDELIAEGAGSEYRFAVATALMADVVWMYVEIFRILAISSRE